MSDIETNKFKKIIDLAYKVYHFVAKVFLYSILIILILVFIGFVAYFADLMKNIKNGETKTPLLSAYIIISPSMVPTIKVEDAIIVLRQEAKELEVGDIITFLSSDPRYSGLTITHRIVGIEKSESQEIYYRTKGDNNNSEDAALVPSSNVYGRVILKIPKIGYIQYVLTKSYGWLIFVVLPCLGIVIYDIIKLFRSVTKTLPKSKKQQKKQKQVPIDLIGEVAEKKIIDTEKAVKKKEEKKKIEKDSKEKKEQDIEVI